MPYYQKTWCRWHHITSDVYEQGEKYMEMKENVSGNMDCSSRLYKSGNLQGRLYNVPIDGHSFILNICVRMLLAVWLERVF